MSAPGIVGIGGAETNHGLNKPEQILLPDSLETHARKAYSFQGTGLQVPDPD